MRGSWGSRSADGRRYGARRFDSSGHRQAAATPLQPLPACRKNAACLDPFAARCAPLVVARRLAAPLSRFYPAPSADSRSFWLETFVAAWASSPPRVHGAALATPAAARAQRVAGPRGAAVARRTVRFGGARRRRVATRAQYRPRLVARAR